MREKNFFTKILPNVSTILVVAVMLIVNRVLAEPSSSPALQTGDVNQLSYQGTLLDNESNPIDGYQDITFRLYNHPTDLTFLWEEAHTGANAVPVSSGLFNVILGSLNPIPGSVWNEVDIYLGVQVGSDSELAPRELINLLPPRIAPESLDGNVIIPGTLSGNAVVPGTITQMHAPSLVKSANGNNEIIRSGNSVFDGSDSDGRITVTYPCFPNGVRAFLAMNGHYNANNSVVVANNGTGRCQTVIIVSPPTSTPIRINWIAIGN